MKVKRFAASEWGGLVFALLLTSPLIYWALDRTEPTFVLGMNVVPPHVEAGTTIYRAVSVDRRRSCATDPDVTIIDSERTIWRIPEPEIASPGPVGREDYKVPVLVPSLAAPGPAEMRVTIRRVCNPVQRFWPLRTDYAPLAFTILPRRE
jgi:hypothetical protein